MRRILRRLRGALGNAIFWGASWFGVMWTFLAAANVAGIIEADDPWRLVLYVAGNAGVTGFLTGGVFSAYLSVAYQDRSLLDLKARRVALGGAAVAALFSAGFGLVLRTSAGIPIIVGDFITGAFWSAALGAVMAAGSIRIAQHAARRVTGRATAELAEEQREVVALLETETV